MEIRQSICSSIKHITKIINIPTHSDQHRIGYPYFQTHTQLGDLLLVVWTGDEFIGLCMLLGHFIMGTRFFLGPSQFAELDSRSRLLCSTLTEWGRYAAHNHFRVNQNEVEKQKSESNNILQNLYYLLHFFIGQLQSRWIVWQPRFNFNKSQYLSQHTAEQNSNMIFLKLSKP